LSAFSVDPPSNTKFNCNSFSSFRDEIYIWTDIHTDTTFPICIHFMHFVQRPYKNWKRFSVVFRLPRQIAQNMPFLSLSPLPLQLQHISIYFIPHYIKTTDDSILLKSDQEVEKQQQRGSLCHSWQQIPYCNIEWFLAFQKQFQLERSHNIKCDVNVIKNAKYWRIWKKVITACLKVQWHNPTGENEEN